jgi:adenosylmethionine-8-amino-7-oxononanoate aminotransferase
MDLHSNQLDNDVNQGGVAVAGPPQDLAEAALAANKTHLVAVCAQANGTVLFLGKFGPTMQAIAAEGVDVVHADPAEQRAAATYSLVVTTAPTLASLPAVPERLASNLAPGGSVWVYGAPSVSMESALSRQGLLIGERAYGADGEAVALRFARRADTSYPLWHPFQPINAMEQQVTTFASGKGCLLVDTNGKEYIDASAGLWNTYCGQGDETIIEAITEQLRTLSYGTLFAWRGNVPALELARELSAMAPPPLQWVYLTTSGSEAVELSVKLARLHARVMKRKCREIVYLDESFHGTFLASMSLSGSTPLREAVGPLLPAVTAIPTPNSIRCPAGQSYVDFALQCANALEERAATGEVAAFIVEPVLGSAGAVAPPIEYFERVQEICRRYKILLIVDEVATGFGRCGTWFASEQLNLRPDILLLSKGMNSGYLPLGATLFSAEIGELLKKAKVGLFHGSTYNGHPACCAAALATIKVMREKKLVERGVELGRYLRDRLAELQELGTVREVRGLGMMLGALLVQEDGTAATPVQVYQVYTALQNAGVLAYMGISSLIFCPPLVISRQEIDTVVERLRGVLQSVRLRNGNVEAKA